MGPDAVLRHSPRRGHRFARHYDQALIEEVLVDGGSADEAPMSGPPEVLRSLRLDVLLRELVDRADDILDVEDRLRRLLDAVMSIAADLSLPDTLRRIVQLAAELAGPRAAAPGGVRPGGPPAGAAPGAPLGA